MENSFFLVLLSLIAPNLLTSTTASLASPPPSPSTALPPSANSMTPTPTAYEMLEKYGFPRGILPEGVQGYNLQPDGSFEVSLSGDCDFHVGKDYKIHYNSRVTGSIHENSISKLDGVKVKIVFAWVGVNEVGRDGDQLKFHLGWINKSFSVDQLSVSPHCN